jgi:hypothetical protein
VLVKQEYSVDKIQKSISKLTVHLISPGPKVNRLDTNNLTFVEQVTTKLSLGQLDNFFFSKSLENKKFKKMLLVRRHMPRLFIYP